MRRARAGYTLLELVIGTAVGSFLTIAAVTFASHQTRLYGMTNTGLEMSQASRSGLARLKQDIRMAGTGVGYTASGDFSGLALGVFSRGTADFNSNNALLARTSGNTVSDDIGLLMANGRYATIASFNPNGTGQLCAGSQLEPNELILVRSEDALSARTVRLTSRALGVCLLGQCFGGCDDVTWAPDPAYLSGVDAATANFSGGEASGDFKRITWFVETTDPTRNDVGRLRRVVGDCAARDHDCGAVVLDNVESLQMRVYQRTRAGWLDRTTQGAPLSGRERIRVDIELVVRARTRNPTVEQDPIILTLEDPLCHPACGTRDNYQRRTVRTSVELKNSGRVSFDRRGS